MATSSVARHAVRKLLESSPAYRALPPDKRREIAHNTARVASYMADPGGLLSKWSRSQGAGAKAGQARAPAESPRRGARAHGPAAAHLAVLRDPRAHDASAATAMLLQEVDFPSFVADLIQGTFNAVVGASIEQMEAYGALLKRVSESVDQFAADGITDAHARDWLAQRYPAQIELDPRGRLRWRGDAQLGAHALAAVLSPCGPGADLRTCVSAARRRMAIDRQQLLATMVMMGINRVVVTDGKIVAKVRRAG